MIISRTPFRISFAGGGSDLPAFYQKEKGAVLSTTIDKYMYISTHPFFNKKQYNLKYSKTELCHSVDEVQHPLFRETFKHLNVGPGIEITSTADIPSGTGLGSSSSFTVGLLHNLYSFKGKFVSKEKLAAEASMIEIEKVGEPIGKQDQYAAAYGGLNVITFNPDGTVDVEPILISSTLRKKMESNLLLFYTKQTRNANEILSVQQREISKDDKFQAQKKMVELVWELRDALYNEDLTSFGQILHKGWLLKKSLTSSISNGSIDNYYELALQAGATGGKLLGAGGGGFLLFYCEQDKQEKVRQALSDLHELKFKMDTQGSKIIYVGEKDWGEENGFFE